MARRAAFIAHTHIFFVYLILEREKKIKYRIVCKNS